MTRGWRLADAVVRWQRLHGRSTLPWQNTRDPYRVWLSEIMLQQTQVATVLGYYERFLARFPDVQALARAPEDAVLAMWSGLGYYSRARNLHRAAQTVVQQHAGIFPATAADLARLPGIGRSTAAAIAAFCYGERVAILDANVRRVLARFAAFAQDLALAAHERELWRLAQQYLPAQSSDMAAYTQGLMDLGATVCTARAPACVRCPLASHCQAKAQDHVDRFPIRTRRVLRKQETWWLLVLRNDQGQVWLERRPPRGIWAGLYSVPIFTDEAALNVQAAALGARPVEPLGVLRHALTHRDLLLHPVLAPASATYPADAMPGAWYAQDGWAALGLPAPIRNLLADLAAMA